MDLDEEGVSVADMKRKRGKLDLEGGNLVHRSMVGLQSDSSSPASLAGQARQDS